MAKELILSRVKSAVTGEEYTIGIRGSMESVALKLAAPSTVDWQSLKVTIQDLSAVTSQYIDLSADGECSFAIPLGHRYSITLPYINGYDQPAAFTYTATINSRNIDYTYGSQQENLVIRIAVRSELEGNNASMFNGLEAIAKSATNEYKGVIENGQVTIQVPYGTNYSIVMPEFDGLAHNHKGETYVAGMVARNLVFSYVDYNNMPIYGLDADGNAYTILELEEMGVEKASSLIVACAFNNKTLAEAQRKDGGVGCGFCFKVDECILKEEWCSVANMDFTTNNEVIAQAVNIGALDEAVVYYGSSSAAYKVKDGDGETSLIIATSLILEDAGLLQIGKGVPSISASRDEILTLGGVSRRGFTLSYGQIKDLSLYSDDLDMLCSLIGKQAMGIKNRLFYTSQLRDSQNAVGINKGVYAGNNTGLRWCDPVFVAFNL